MTIELGALLFAEQTSKATANDLGSIKRLVAQLEELGYSRCWFSEHHHGVLHTCPEIMIAALASQCSKMILGSAGVLLRLYSPLKIADQFRLLASLFPDRVELGIAGGLPPLVRQKLLLGDDFNRLILDSMFLDKLSDLTNILQCAQPCSALPLHGPNPMIWMMGSSVKSAAVAGRLGLAYCYGMFLLEGNTGVEQAKTAVEVYRSNFSGSRGLSTPRWSVALSGVCSHSDENAKVLSALNTAISVIPNILGDAARCADFIFEVSEKTETNEIVFADLCLLAEDKLTSLSLIAKSVLGPKAQRCVSTSSFLSRE
jgi:luciferase family oxidoreductase group 1